jgi:hypothetical protein
MSARWPHCGQTLPAPKEEFDLGFIVAPPDNTSFGDRYDTIRKVIEVARKDLRNKGWARLYKLLLDLKRLGSERPELRHFDSVCKTIFNKLGDEVNQILEAWQVSDSLAEVGFSEQILRGPEEVIEHKVNYADPKAFNLWRTKRAIKEYRHYRMWKRPHSI